MSIVSDQWYEFVTLPSSQSVVRTQQRKFVLFLGVFVLTLNVCTPAQPDVTQRVFASLLIILAGIPTLLWFSGRDRGTPFLVILGYIYATYYALPIFLLENYTRDMYLVEAIPSFFIGKALVLSFFGLLTLLIGYYFLPEKILIYTVPRINFHWEDYRNVKVVAIAMSCAGIIMYFIKASVESKIELGQVVQFMADLATISIAILYVLQLRGHLKLIDKSFLWGVVVPIRILAGLATGATLQGLEIVLLLILIYAALRHSMPWKLLIAGGVAFLVLRPVQVPFRTLSWPGGEAESQHLTAKAALFLKTAEQLIAGEDLPYADALQLSLFRLAHLMTFAEIIEKTPAQIPFWGGETLYPLLFKPIPRLLYPEKPREISGQTFGHLYGFLSPDDETTSYNLPHLVEFYGNFGIPGVLVGMFCLGVLYRVIQYIFIHLAMGLGALVGSVYIFTRLLMIESSLSLVIGGLFWPFIFLGLLHMVIKTTEHFCTLSRAHSPANETSTRFR
jgi:hypothetical protein